MAKEKSLVEEAIIQMKNLEEEMTPFGFVDDGVPDNTIVDANGTAWKGGRDENLDMGWSF